MKVGKNNPKVEILYTSLKGTEIFGFKDIMAISPSRGVSALKAKRFASLNLTKDELTRLLTAAKVSINTKQDFVEAFAILQEIEYRNKMVCEESSLLELAYIYLLIEDEEDDTPNEQTNLKKAALLNEQTDLKGFFLQNALVLMENFSTNQQKTLLTYLEETKNLTQRIYNYIPKIT